MLNGEQSNTEAEGPAAGRENALQYADSEAEAAAGTMLAIFLLLISAAALFIADLAAKKKHIVSEKKPEHSGSRGHA